ncbi:MAG: ABC transporter ATP-binding protein [Eubacterium sp.]|nr:ABC transporter ATP-binding protein [Eubacterium sp.]
MKKILSYMKAQEWVYFVLFVGLIFGQVLLSLKLPDFMQGITNAMQAGNGDIGDLVMPAILMLLCTLGSVACAVLGGLCLALLTSKVIQRMRAETFQKIISFDLADMNTLSPSSLITRCTNDIAQIQNFSGMGLQILIQAPITVVIAVMKMGSNGKWLTVTIAVAVILTIIALTLFLCSISKTTRVQKLMDTINRITKEHLTGMRVVHAYNGYDYQKNQFETVNSDLTKNNITANRLIGSVGPFFTLSINLLNLIIVYLGGVMIRELVETTEKQSLFAEMVVFSSYAVQAISAFAMMIIIIAALPRTVVSIKRINEVLYTENAIKDGHAETGANGQIGTIEFRDVSFRYPGSPENVLSNISFRVERGQTVAIVGATGSGKTTLMNLIPRFYDATEGVVMVDGRDVRDYKLWALRDRLGYVPQKSFLFSGTIYSNIDYGQRTGLQNTLSDIKKASEIGQSRDFIEKKEGGYEARVEEGGSNFSGGQRQRLTISRAVCRDPEMYLFDDSFSALDFKTDATLRKTLRSHAKDATQIIVGQRIGSIMHADNILVLDKGEIVGSGTHEELLANCPIYQEIASSQMLTKEVG